MSDGNSSEEDPPPSKRQKPSGPTSLITWNANGLISRCKANEDCMRKLLKETSNPDILCLQEVRLKAASSTNRGTPLDSEYKPIKPVIDSVFADYDKCWSLASNKYAGTLTLIHKRHQFSKDNAVFCIEAAISLLLAKYNLSRSDAGLPSKDDSPKKKEKKEKKQSTMMVYFAPKAKMPHKHGKATLTSTEHQEEGRFQFFAFDGFDLVNTYVPNNGTKEESFQRRREWDAAMKTFITRRKSILEKAGKRDRPLLWVGDFNCARDYRDGTHWEKTGGGDSGKKSNSDEPDIYEWWKDESQCFVAEAAKKLESDRDPGDIGIPSFTTNERNRFAELLQEGDFADIWRNLYPDGVKDDEGRYKTEWDRPNWTWRGHLSKDGNAYQSKYQGRGQRLDYFLLSPSSLTPDIVEECRILGYGERREGFYCGSDHCPVILRLKRPLEKTD